MLPEGSRAACGNKYGNEAVSSLPSLVVRERREEKGGEEDCLAAEKFGTAPSAVTCQRVWGGLRNSTYLCRPIGRWSRSVSDWRPLKKRPRIWPQVAPGRPNGPPIAASGQAGDLTGRQ